MEDATRETPDSKRGWFEPVTALLMAFVTLGTAWCSYQSSRWSGLSGGESDETSRLERRAMELHLENYQFKPAYLHVFTEWLDARLDDKETNAAFYESRFPPDMRKAFDAWMAQKPFENKAADPHPFVPKLYTSSFETEARAALVGAAMHSGQAGVMSRNFAGYLGDTELLAAVLFFAGTATRFHQRWVRQSRSSLRRRCSFT